MASQAQIEAPVMRPVHPAPLAAWLFFVAALVLAMIVVGGITRLTESGLSIVHWEPIKGAIPPLNQEQWQQAFDAYRQSPQYQLVNSGMSLAEFKNIFFWEYVHRLLGRIIGLAFALPLLWFAVRRRIPAGFGWKLIILLALGGLQGVIGWWMVASGLVERPEVSHIRLAVHLLTALLIFGSLIWVGLDLRRLGRIAEARPARMPTLAIWILSLLALQYLFGAYTAGLEAGYAFSSWPKMGDQWFPAETPMLTPMLRNFVDNPIVVQFVHRWLAWIVAAAAFLLARAAWRQGDRKIATAVVAAVLIQILLGIFTLLSGVDLWIAVAHQGMAAVLLGSIIAAAHRLGSRTA
ncbi:COX15/CtaA family protein [Sphingosinicella rhizophila]|uniref:Heme A synthase n=1 Tax=Sphingosinicella rhizophila TaxID=3050082 RepID=A0ABU3Q498_9SPHN|nr:COX15/CtaA family protein [Sphingosinicella sp. GR2756]MDT9598245.1 COX15/CtaA family protein [Sphingosinicella sp. GR2756]